MTHWGYYWKIKRSDYITKALCDWWPDTLDSFNMFNKKNRAVVQMIKESDRVSITIPSLNLVALLKDDDSLSVTYQDGNYVIPVEKKPCNYGGNYYFFRCPQCSKRMRLLYRKGAKYLCRKCANISYYTQTLRPSERNKYMLIKIERYIKDRGGEVSFDSYVQKKPLNMKQRKVKQLSDRLRKYDKKYINTLRSELISWYPSKTALIYRFIE